LGLAALPFVVLLAGGRFGTKAGAAVVLVLVAPGLVRTAMRAVKHPGGLGFGLPAGIIGLLILAAAMKDARYVLAYPTLVNGALLLQFGGSLWRGPPVVERLARLQVPNLSPEEVRYCRTVTVVWCAFFVANGATVTTLALLAPRSWWAAYAGGVSYLLVGILFSGEYVVRKMRFGRFGAGLIDSVLASVLGRSAAAP
jgi:uncharacterized membrane protein